MSIIVVFDTETTGLKALKGDRIIEIAMIGYQFDIAKPDIEGVEKFRIERRFSVNKAIDPKAQMVHKISQADLVGKPEFKEVEPLISRVFDKSDLVVAHNINFDVGFLYTEYSMIGKTIPNVEGFCTMENARWATSKGKNPNLGELCYALEVDYDPTKAHAALYDVQKTAECLFAGIKRGGYKMKNILKKGS
jgi:DNA polymerase-3 subunit epsilon